MEFTEKELVIIFNSLIDYEDKELSALQYFRLKHPDIATFFKKHQKTLPGFIDNLRASQVARLKVVDASKPSKRNSKSKADTLADLEKTQHFEDLFLLLTSVN